MADFGHIGFAPGAEFGVEVISAQTISGVGVGTARGFYGNFTVGDTAIRWDDHAFTPA